MNQHDFYDLEFLGPHDKIAPKLFEFVKGDVVRSNFEKRPNYSGQKVIDMSKIRMCFFRNEPF